MKYISRVAFYVTLVLIAAFTFVGCEIIAEEDRLMPSEQAKSQRVVLLEEFTGVRCTNCPHAAKIAHDLLHIYPNNLIVVGLHGSNTGSYGTPFEGAPDFRVKGVEEIFEAMGGTANPGYVGYPFGMVNRMVFDNTEFTNPDEWAAYVKAEMTKKPNFDIVISKNGNETSSSIDIKIDIKTLEEIDKNLSLVVQVVEDGVVAPQLNDGEVEHEYVHNGVLRSFVNGVWGEPHTAARLGNTISKTYTINFDSKWKKDNCSIIAYLYDATSKRRVEQAAILPVTKKTDDPDQNPTTSIKIKNELAFNHLGSTYQLEATLNLGAKDSISWVSMDTNAVKVDTTGLVTAMGYGVTKVIATTSNGLTDTCKVTVVETTGDFSVFRKTSEGLKPVNDGDTLVLDEMTTSFTDMDGLIYFKGYIFNNTAERKFMELNAIRTDYISLADEGCVGSACIPNNGEESQIFKGSADAYTNSTFDCYLKPKNKTVPGTYEIKYEFYDREVPEDKITCVVIFHWTPIQ